MGYPLGSNPGQLTPDQLQTVRAMLEMSPVSVSGKFVRGSLSVDSVTTSGDVTVGDDLIVVSDALVAGITAVGSLLVGSGGTLITKYVEVTKAAVNPPNTANLATWTETVSSVTGAALGDIVLPPVHSSITGGGWQLSGVVTAANTVVVTALNVTGGAVDLASGTLTVGVLKT